MEHPPVLCEVVPMYKFGGRAIPFSSEHRMISLRRMHVLQQPTHFVLVKVVNGWSGRTWDERWASLSIGSWVLITTMILSFFQWGLIAWLVTWWLRRQTPKRALGRS